MRGCADLTVSDDGMSTERHHDVTTVLCNQTGERWHVLCRDGQWFGVPLTNCSSRREYRIIIIIIVIIVIIAVTAPAQKTSQVISRSENPQARSPGVRGRSQNFILGATEAERRGGIGQDFLCGALFPQKS